MNKEEIIDKLRHAVNTQDWSLVGELIADVKQMQEDEQSTTPVQQTPSISSSSTRRTPVFQGNRFRVDEKGRAVIDEEVVEDKETLGAKTLVDEETGQQFVMHNNNKIVYSPGHTTNRPRQDYLVVKCKRCKNIERLPKEEVGNPQTYVCEMCVKGYGRG